LWRLKFQFREPTKRFRAKFSQAAPGGNGPK
jgi:hypothetical protein